MIEGPVGGFLAVADEEVVGLGFWELEAQRAEDEAEFFVREEAVFVGVEEVELYRVRKVWGKGGERGRTASPTRVFCSSESLLKSSREGMVYWIAREEDAIFFFRRGGGGIEFVAGKEKRSIARDEVR